jgi:hypothetical protein
VKSVHQIVVRPHCIALGLMLLAGCSRYGGAEASSKPTSADASIAEIALKAPPQIVAPHGGDVSVAVPFKNPSQTLPLELKLKSKSCECVDFVLDPPSVAPGAEAVMTLKSRVGDASTLRNLELVFDTGLQQPQRLRFSVDVQACPVIEFTPNVSPLLTIPFGKSGQFEFDVYLHQPETEQELEPHFSTDCQHATLSWAEKQGLLYQGIRRRVFHCVATVTVPPREQFVDAAHLQTSLVSVAAGEHLGQVRVLWRPQNLVQSRPETLLVNGRQAGMFEKSFVLEAETPFQIVSVESENPQFEIQATLGERRKRHELRLRLDRQPEQGAQRKSWITATIDHPEEQTVKIPVYIFE